MTPDVMARTKMMKTKHKENIEDWAGAGGWIEDAGG